MKVHDIVISRMIFFQNLIIKNNANLVYASLTVVLNAVDMTV